MIKYRCVKRRNVCVSLGGVLCDYLVITSPSDPKNSSKLGAILTARAHPGETVGSFIMKGVIDFLSSNDPYAEELRRHFIFIIVPMLNIDGVVVGNNRNSLDGSDLNRKFRYPSKVKYRINCCIDNATYNIQSKKNYKRVLT